jgi:hypothetical protein
MSEARVRCNNRRLGGSEGWRPPNSSSCAKWTTIRSGVVATSELEQPAPQCRLNDCAQVRRNRLLSHNSILTQQLSHNVHVISMSVERQTRIKPMPRALIFRLDRFVLHGWAAAH